MRKERVKVKPPKRVCNVEIFEALWIYPEAERA